MTKLTIGNVTITVEEARPHESEAGCEQCDELRAALGSGESLSHRDAVALAHGLSDRDTIARQYQELCVAVMGNTIAPLSHEALVQGAREQRQTARSFVSPPEESADYIKKQLATLVAAVTGTTGKALPDGWRCESEFAKIVQAARANRVRHEATRANRKKAR